MALETYELDKKMLEYSISQFRNIPEYVKMCEAFAVGCGTIQTAVDYLSDMIDVDKANGIWLDYIGWLVGIKREDLLNISDYFCVNRTQTVTFYAWTSNLEETVYTLKDRPSVGDNVYSDTDGTILGAIGLIIGNTITALGVDYTKDTTNNISKYSGDINEEKLFWFQNQTTNQQLNLTDEIYRRQIYGKIGYNISKGTRNENIRIIKNITLADHVIIDNIEPMVLDITLYGDNILQFQELHTYIENILGNGVGINNLVIRGLNEYGN